MTPMAYGASSFPRPQRLHERPLSHHMNSSMRRSLKGTLALAVLAAACAIPTEAPNWDMAWNLPLPQENGPQKIGVQKMLPDGVTLIAPIPPATAPSAFNAQVNSVPPINRTLGVQCPTCPSATAPKPAFTAPPATTTINLTAGTALNTATLFTGSQIVLTLANGFTFDPINPPGGSPGTVTLTVANGSATLGTLTLLGGAQTIPAGQSRQVTIPLAGSINTAQPLSVTMTMDSPAGAAGQPVSMNPNHLFSVSAAATINISTAVVSIGSQSIDSPGQIVDLAGIDTTIANRVPDSASTQGRMFLSVTTPYTVSANTVLTFSGTREVDTGSGTSTTVAITPVIKNFTMPARTPGQSTFVVSIPLTGQELRRMLGSTLTATFTGATNPGTTVVTPASEILITGRMQIHVYARELK
jgi:hypothetical protein